MRQNVTLYVNCLSRDIVSGTTGTPCSLAFLTTEFHKGLKQQKGCNDQSRGHPVRQYNIHTHNKVERRSLNNRDTLRFNQRYQKTWAPLFLDSTLTNGQSCPIYRSLHYRESPQICSNGVQIKQRVHGTKTVPFSHAYKNSWTTLHSRHQGSCNQNSIFEITVNRYYSLYKHLKSRNPNFVET